MNRKLCSTLAILILSLHLFAQDKKPMVMIGNAADGGTTTKEQVLAHPILADVNGLYTINNFTVSFLIDNGHTLFGPFTTMGNRLTKEQMDQLRSLKPPIKIVFDGMKATSKATGKTVHWSRIILNVNK